MRPFEGSFFSTLAIEHAEPDDYVPGDTGTASFRKTITC